MDNQRATTPEGFRTAAYLEARARLDARRKTGHNVQCNPPNVRCGNRCIPPTWDCRLKGQGGDKHLAAVKTDPLGGLANIERGSRRIIRGVAKGSFSEVEGGKRAIIRGTVKIAPGNLQQKKELQAKLENRTRAIGIGLAVLTGGLGAHALLMKQSPFYRKGLGQSINESVQHGVNSILDATPGIAGRRSRTRIGAYGAISEAATRETRNPTISPAALTSGLDTNSPAALNQLRTTQVGISNVTGNSNLNNALNRVNTQARQGSTSNIYEWDQKHREAFWNTTIKADEIDRDINVFARPAAENFIRNQYNLTTTGSATDIKEALRLKLSEERNAYVQYAKQAGFRTETQGGTEFVHKDDQFRFIQTLNRNAGLTGTLNRNAKDLADAHVTKLISPTSLSGYSRSIYNQNLKDFDRFYTQVGAAVRSTPGAASLREELALSSGQRVVPTLSNSQQEFVSALSGTRVAEMSRRLSSARLNSGQSVGFSRPIAGNAHSELVKTAYYHIEVIGRESQRRPNALNSGNGRFRGPRTYTITDRLATNAASELAGRSVADPTEAFRLLNSEYGFPGATRVQAAAPARRQSAGAAKQAGLSALARDIMARSGNEGMTLEAALRAARQERGDAADDLVAPEVVRTATFLAARADLKESPHLGKPCGASHIPKAHECRKSGNQSKPSTGQILTVAAVATGAVVAASVLAANPKLRQRARIGGKRLTRGTDATVRQALILGGRGTIAGLSTKQVKAGLDKLPEAFQGPARQLVGAAKQSAAAMSLRAEGYSIQDIDVVNNYSTWKNKQGTLLSIGSYGDSLVTYASSKSHTWKGKPVYKIGFNVDQNYDATRSMPGDQARSITAGVRKMSDNHLAKINDGILATFPWDGDEYGAKRRAIYTRAGFNNISGEASQWALVEKGRIKKMSSSESFIYLAESGERDAPIYKPSKAKRKDSLF